jgi:hypothetical protein
MRMEVPRNLEPFIALLRIAKVHPQLRAADVHEHPGKADVQMARGSKH